MSADVIQADPERLGDSFLGCEPSRQLGQAVLAVVSFFGSVDSDQEAVAVAGDRSPNAIQFDQIHTY
jgi:hypothetical protein